MSDQPPDAGAPPGMQVSPDGMWVWNGTAWVPNPSAARLMPIPYAAPAPTQYAPVAYPTAGGYVVAPKNPAVSLIVSFFLPGVGSMITATSASGSPSCCSGSWRYSSTSQSS